MTAKKNDKRITVWLSEEDFNLIRKAAELDNRSLSNYLGHYGAEVARDKLTERVENEARKSNS